MSDYSFKIRKKAEKLLIYDTDAFYIIKNATIDIADIFLIEILNKIFNNILS